MTAKWDVIRDKAVQLLKENPGGLRLSELKKKLTTSFPITDGKWTIENAIWNLDVKREKEIFKPSRGLFKYRFADEKAITEIERPPATLREEDFYESFASWLKEELGECSEACALGSNYLSKKWGTPDVIGIYKPSPRDVIKFQPEIISAELKINPSDPITAFGQSVAYRLFSSKVYLVEPSTMVPEDQDRVEALCILFGIGLILFDLDAKSPNYRIRVRAQRYNPDMFYVNDFADKLYSTKEDIFKKLLG